jgi:SSS family solute:Na+ symporter
VSGLDGLIVLVFVALAIRSGLRARRQASRSLEEYFLAGRSLPGWKAGVSMAATQFAADTPLLVTGLIATAGIFALWRLWIYAVAFLLLGFVLAPLWRRARVLTDAELAELRYGAAPASWLRGIKAVYFGTIFNCTVLAMVLWAAKEIAEPFLVWNEWLPPGLFGIAEAVVTRVGVPFAREIAGGSDLWLRSTNNVLSLLAIVGVTALYSTTGGLRSVVQTDVMQFALMMGGTAAYAVFVVHAVGGLETIPVAIHERFAEGGPGGIAPSEILAFTPSRARDAGLVVLAVFALQWLVQMNADGTGYLAQRAMACRSDADARQAAVIFTLLQVVLRSLLWLPIGLGLLLIFPPNPDLADGALAAEREVTFVRGMAELLPSGLRGLLLTAMLAALASTLDTHLNWGASYWTNDLYRRFFCEMWRGRSPGQRELVWVARGSNLLILGIALAVMTRLSSIQVAWHVSLLLGAGMGVPLLLRWLWWRFDAWGEIGAIGSSILLAPALLRWVPPEQEALRLLVMAVGSTAAGVALSLFAGPETPECLRLFYRRVRPPGFWGPVARAEGVRPGDDRRRLARGLAATALGSLSVFCILAGLGTALAGSPAPAGWTLGRQAWIALQLLAGFGLVPFWWRLGLAPGPAPDGPLAARDQGSRSGSTQDGGGDDTGMRAGGPGPKDM